MYTEREALSSNHFNNSGILVYCVGEDDNKAPTPRPAPHGSPQHCLAKLPFSNLRWLVFYYKEKYDVFYKLSYTNLKNLISLIFNSLLINFHRYFALRATDSSNNTGKISNIVSAWVSEPTTINSNSATDSSFPAQTVILSTVTSLDGSGNVTVATNGGYNHALRLYIVAGVAALAILLLIGATIACICCCRRARANAEKDPDRPIYKIYVNNAYIQEEDGEIKVVSNGKVTDDKDPGQVRFMLLFFYS